MRNFAVASITVFVAVVLAAPAASAQEDSLSRLEPAGLYSHENLAVVALQKSDATERPDGNYLTFDEASKRDLIEVTELDGETSEARVEQVEVTNKSDRPIFLMAGEIILGGKQDRVIRSNTVVPPGAEALKVDVYCVERGRWNGSTASFESSGKMGHSKLRQKAKTSSQREVWDEVEKTNKKQKAETKTGSYKASLEKAEGDADVASYVEAIVPKLKGEQSAVGIAVAIDGEVVAIDAFANPKLFARVRTKLVESYALEAATRDDKKPDASVAKSDVRAFMKEISKKRKARETESKGGAENTSYEFESGTGSKTESDGKTIHQFYRKK